MRRTALGITLLTTFLITIATGNLVNLAEGNPYLYEEEKREVAPPPDIASPSIAIFSPRNDAMNSANNVTLTFNLHFVVPTLPALFYSYVQLSEVHYEASWLSNKTSLDIETAKNAIPKDEFISEDNYKKWGTYEAVRGYEFSYNFSLSVEDVPDGSHSLKVSAILSGLRQTGLRYSTVPVIIYGRYTLTSSSRVAFSIDSIGVLSPQKKAYNSSNVSLFLKVPKSITRVSYSLDGGERLTFAKNMTLTGLPNGNHNLTVYTTDEAGNTGASETVFFYVEVPFPIVPVAVSIAVAASVAVGFLVYWKKHKHQSIRFSTISKDN